MSDAPNLDRVRGAALDRIERGERQQKATILAEGLMEAALLLGFVVLGDLRHRVHLLIFLAAVAVYGIVCLGLVVLGIHVTKCTERVLKALELLDRTGRPPGA